uniref:transposase n=1 Tax=Leeuwenhoekiella marinoflava TaxID=988 RepID=UPI0013E8E0EB|nr:transposase [Leeuwenhoekiella marinoflava]
MKGKRQSTVEPVFGTLTQFMGLRKVNTIGLKQANKCMQLSAIAYNLKKYLKFTQKRVKSGAGMLSLYFRLKTTPLVASKALLTYVNFPSVSRI